MEELLIENGILKACNAKGITSIKVPEGVHTIGEGAFKGCVSLEQVILPDTVTEILANAFKGCRKLREVKLPSGLTFIGDYAFHRCHQLGSIEIPEGVERLGNCVFLYCDSLESIRMPGVRTLGLQVFLNDVNLKRLLISAELNPESICDCFTGCGRMEEVAFSDGTVYHMENAVAVLAPEPAAPPLVKAIATDICRMMELKDGVITRFLTNIKHVELAEGITAIGKSCFFDKKGIISVKLPKSLKEIGSRAFRNCINLERVEFAGSQASVHKDAFKNCTTLRRIRLEDGTEYELAGLQCLADENVPAVVKEIHAQVLGNFSISGTTLLKYRGSEERVVVPDGVTVIGERAFAGNEAIDRVILPNSLRIIEEEAFADCLILQTITFPQGLKRIGRSAFENCVKLIRAILPDSLTFISPSAFSRCRALNEVQLGNAVKEIGSQAFYGCGKLKNVDLPPSLMRLGDLAFYKCLSFKEVHLPCGLEELGSNVFTLSGVRSALVQCDLKSCGTDVFSQCGKLRRLKFGEGVRRIGDKFAFQCENLAYVDLPSSLEAVGRHAFEGSRFRGDMEAHKTVNGILLDGSGFEGDVILGEEVTSIAGGAFYGNKRITSVRLPERVRYIGSGAFCGCSRLTHINLPAGVTILEPDLFLRCSSLAQVFSPGVVATVGERAFSGCIKLTRIPSLAGCVRIGKEAFSGCRELEVIEGLEAGGKILTIGDRAFEDTPFKKALAGQSGAVVIGGILADGSGCLGAVEIPEGVAAVADYAFCGNEQITSLYLPESLNRIGESAFAGCKGLKHIFFGKNRISLGKAAFEKCISLKDISFRAADIGDRAFAWCKSLLTVQADGVGQIGAEAFCGCESLAECSSSQARVIGNGAFCGCQSLESFDFSSVEWIGSRAFERCDSLTGISIKETVVLESHAFEDCGKLGKVSILKGCPDGGGMEEPIPEGDRGIFGDGLCLGSYAFSGCTALCQVQLGTDRYPVRKYQDLFDRNLPETVRRIYGSALSCFAIDEEYAVNAYYNSGKFVTVPEGVARIDGEVFRDRARLEEVVIPDSLEYIGPRAFDKTPWLERQAAGDKTQAVVKGILIAAPDCRGEIIIPPEIKRISGWAFANCTELTGVTFTSDRIAVEDHAFRNCIHLKRVVWADGTEYKLTGLPALFKELPPVIRQIFADCYNCFKTDAAGTLTECTGNISRLTLPAGIRAVGDGAFRESNLLTRITLPDETVSIGNGAFLQCKWLETVEHVSEVTQIGKRAFSGCIRLSYIDPPKKLTALGERAFENCTSLQEMILPEGLEEIPQRAFFRCHQLRRVKFPSTLKRIGKEAFAFCTQLSEICLPEGVELVEERAFAWCGQEEERL